MTRSRFVASFPAPIWAAVAFPASAETTGWQNGNPVTAGDRTLQMPVPIASNHARNEELQ